MLLSRNYRKWPRWRQHLGWRWWKLLWGRWLQWQQDRQRKRLLKYNILQHGSGNRIWKWQKKQIFLWETNHTHQAISAQWVTILDPRGRPHSQVVRPSVEVLQNQAKIIAGRNCGLGEWIIDDSCLVFHI